MKKTFLLALVLLSLSSCKKDDEFINVEASNQTNEQEIINITLGEKLDIPFTVKNMQKAYDKLLTNNNNSSVKKQLNIKASHYYYQFLPKDSIQYEKLVKDSILDVSDVPLHYEIKSNGNFYQDPTLKESKFTYYYSVFPVDYKFPKEIEHRKIEDFYFPPEEDNDSKSNLASSSFKDNTSNKLEKLYGKDFYDVLETQALLQTNNLDKEELLEISFINSTNLNSQLTYNEAVKEGLKPTDLTIKLYDDNKKISFRRRRWNPHGRITVEEGALTRIGSRNNIVGIQGAEIKVRKWGLLVIKKARTNVNGNFTTGRTRTKRVKYAVHFNGPFFVVKAASIFKNAKYRDTYKHRRKGWFKHFSEGSRTHFYALIQNAAFDYYTRIVPTYRLSMPKPLLKISAKYTKCGSSEYRPQILSSNLPVSSIKITRRQRGCVYRQSDGIYATTVHELTHAGHRQLDPGMYSVVESGSKNRLLLQESWAEGVETILTNDRYLRLDRNYRSSAHRDGGGLWGVWRQRRAANEMDAYTPIVVDLIDDFNQNIEENRLFPVDRVNGYTLQQIQRAIDNCRNIDCWENNLRNYYNNPTERNLTELFNYVRAVRNNAANW